MERQDKREKLLDFLDSRVFDPVLEASPEDYNEKDRKKLKDVIQVTRSTKQRYHKGYQTAREVVENFKAESAAFCVRRNTTPETWSLPATYPATMRTL
jgi:hypothetical protein